MEWIRKFWWIYLVSTFISKAFDKWCVIGLFNITFEIAEDFRFDSLDIIFASVRFAIFLESVCAAISLRWQDVWVVVRKCCLDIFSKDTKWIPIDHFVDTKEETRFVIFESKVSLEKIFETSEKSCSNIKYEGYEILVGIRKRFVMWWHIQETEILVHFRYSQMH